MKRFLAVLIFFGIVQPFVHAAEITEVLDAADTDDPFDFNIDVNFHSVLQRSKITHEWSPAWTATSRPDFDELRYKQQIYQMDYTIQIGLYHDIELYAVLPWVISDKKTINFVSGVNPNSSTVFSSNPEINDAVAIDPSTSPTVKRDGIGDMQVGIKWAPFNDQRDDTKSVWLIGFDYRIPTGSLNNPQQAVRGSGGGVGMGQHVFTPFMMFSHRMNVLDPYVGIWGSIPVQGKAAKDLGLVAPYEGGVLVGMEIVPWENQGKHQKFAVDVRLNADYVSEINAEGDDHYRGTVNELSDFLVCVYCASSPEQAANYRQLQSQTNYSRFGLHLGFVVRAAELLRFRAGVSLVHNTEHFITGADYCIDKTGEGDCGQSADVPNKYYNAIYDVPGRRLRVEETTVFTYWFTGMLTF